MAIMVKVEATVDPERVSEAIEFLREKFPETRAYSGCQDVTAFLNDDGKTFVFVEHWDSKEHFEKYMTWRQESGTFGVFLGMLEGEIDVRFFERTRA